MWVTGGVNMEQGEQKNRYSHTGNFVFLFLLVVVLIAVYTFILQKSYAHNTLEAVVERNISCSDAVHEMVSNKFSRQDYEEIDDKADMKSERYQSLQATLNELRRLNSIRYLYTAKQDADGRLIYLVDGLDLLAEDFAYPGTYIEEEMIPYISAALSGETIYSQEIMDTTWGHIFTACYPVRANDGSNEIIGALCIEMDMESAYTWIETSNQRAWGLAVIAVLVSLVLIAWVYQFTRRQKERERKQQQLLEESAAAADAANQAKSTFLFNMSHDIRTPMNAIIGYAELAGNHLEEPQVLHGYMENIRICGKKMLSIIDNVLELARIENNETTLEESVTNAEDMFDSCILMFHVSLEAKHQTLTTAKDIRYPYVYMDSSRVSEIILNIISNANKYTGDGGTIHCAISQEPMEEAGWCMTTITISDNGIGMSEEFQQHIFESFSRERSSTISGVDGTGLGMGIVKKLVDLMGGTIAIHSVLAEGSTFTVRIPSRIAKEEDAKARRATVPLDKTKLSGRRILLAEDNDLNAEIAQELLGEEGLLVERADNGVTCVEMLEKAPSGYYDLILMDVQMPVMNGYEATGKIRKLQDKSKAQIPIIAMTANAFAEDRKKALAVGMNDHVAKPIDMNTLIPTMQKYLQ